MQRFVKPSLVLTTLLVVSLFLTIRGTHAQAESEHCFPETGQCVRGRFLEYWQQNGGLEVFGYPIASANVETSTEDGKTYLTQWFERNRFELHPENQPPYDVLLGLLGKHRLEQTGQDWTTFPKSDPSALHYFEETGHAIAPEFWAAWSSRGLDFDGNPEKSIQENLSLFGYPISPATLEVNAADGNEYLTQWFERARFEYHPENAPPSDVLLGLLGTESMSTEPTDTEPTDTEPTDTEPTDTERVSGTCAANAPAPTEGSQIWLTNDAPAPGDEITVCALLTLNGAPQADVFYAIQLFYGAEYEPDMKNGFTDAQGFASANFAINPSASPGDEIRADAVFSNQPSASVTFTIQ